MCTLLHRTNAGWAKRRRKSSRLSVCLSETTSPLDTSYLSVTATHSFLLLFLHPFYNSINQRQYSTSFLLFFSMKISTNPNQTLRKPALAESEEKEGMGLPSPIKIMFLPPPSRFFVFSLLASNSGLYLESRYSSKNTVPHWFSEHTNVKTCSSDQFCRMMTFESNLTAYAA